MDENRGRVADVVDLKFHYIDSQPRVTPDLNFFYLNFFKKNNIYSKQRTLFFLLSCDIFKIAVFFLLSLHCNVTVQSKTVIEIVIFIHHCNPTFSQKLQMRHF